LDFNDINRTSDAKNAEGFHAWKMSDETRLEQLAMAGTMGDSFYVSATYLAKDAIALLERLNAQSLSDAIVRGRNNGLIRSYSILGLSGFHKKTRLYEVHPKSWTQLLGCTSILKAFSKLRLNGLQRTFNVVVRFLIKCLWADSARV